MIKSIELIVVLTLMVFSFVVGVKYSDSVKSHAGWLFEAKEEEVDLPDLTNESGTDSVTVYDSGAVDNGEQMPQESPEGVAAPMDGDSGADATQNEVAAPETNTVTAPSKSKRSAPAAKQ